jgi:two-component system CheB/CheR fusion protein
LAKNTTDPNTLETGAGTEEELSKLHPIVAIGASAGGLQALNELLENLPANLGMSYIIIQHLSPTHESILPELLASKTSMPVKKVEHGIHLEKDEVYVIPPNTFMSIVDSVLTLSERIKTKGMHYSIDHFLNALAPVYQTKAIAVILSGTGSDGTLGVQSIKAHGGITYAQDETAAFLGMPKMASDSGYIDFVLPCKRIAEELASVAQNPQDVLSMNEVVEANQTELKKIQLLLHHKKGVDFGYYKQTTVNRRIMRRMALNKFKKLSDYSKYLRENEAEITLLYKDLLINVTNFFRDPNVYEALGKKIFPALLKNRTDGDIIRIWTPACANGEEAYSLAIALFDFLKEKAISTPIQIFGTDLNETAIDKARVGVYNPSVLQNVSPQRLKRYFMKIDGHYQIIKAIRDVCIFATHNLLKDPPFSRMDLISCQNMLIYIENNPQKKIMQAFHYSIKPTGFLLLGKSETIGSSTDLFTQLDKEYKIYSRKETSPGNNFFDFSMRSNYQPALLPASSNIRYTEPFSEIDIEKETERLLLSRYVPACVVVNKDLQILRFHGATSNYLQPSSGRASLHLLKMVKDELVFELKGLVNKAKQEGNAVRKDGIHLSQNGHSREISIEMVPIKSPVKDYYYLILFREVITVVTQSSTVPAKGKNTQSERIAKLEQQLTEARDYMKTMSEEFEATREELQSANEEVLSSNEELQSINEELETSKEEMQSTNEELLTINEELQLRNNDLKEASDFSHAIVETINEPLLVLGPDMRIRTANKAFYALFKTNVDRTEGHYFFEMENGQWNLEELRNKLLDIVHKGKSFENCEVTKVFSGIGEKTLVFNALRMDQDDSKRNRILLVIQDVSAHQKTERELKEREERFRLLLQNAFDIMTIFSASGDIIFQSDAMERTLGYPVNETLHRNIFQLGIIHPEDMETNRGLLQESIAHPGKNIRGQVRLKHINSHYLTMEVVLRNFLNNASIGGIIANYQNVSNYISY